MAIVKGGPTLYGRYLQSRGQPVAWPWIFGPLGPLGPRNSWLHPSYPEVIVGGCFSCIDLDRVPLVGSNSSDFIAMSEMNYDEH